MNILVFSWRDPKHPLAGGAEQVMHEHMRGWLAAGHKVTLFASRFPGSSSIEIIDNVCIIRGGFQYLGVQISGFIYYLKHKYEYDLVVDQFHGLPFFTPLYVSKPKVAVIQETAQRVWFLNPLPWPINTIVGLVGYALEPFIFLFYRNVTFITGSESAKEDVVKFGIPKENVTVILHGVIIEKSKHLIKKEKIKTVVFLGILSKDKGIEDAIRCFALLRESGEYQFWIVGKPENDKYAWVLSRLVKQLGLEKNVTFWGFVSQKKKFELLARAHVLVNPSVHEGWGLVNIEANAVGTPVVAYASRGLIDSVKDGVSGKLCSPCVPEVLAYTTRKVLNTQVYKRYQQGALQWSDKFSWDQSRKLSIQLIEKQTGLARI